MIADPRAAAAQQRDFAEHSGESQVARELFDAVYTRLKAMAGRQLSQHRGDTLDTTALVHELYLRIGTNPELAFEHPAQFFTYAARAMRHLLSDRARDRMRQRAGGDWLRVTLTGLDDPERRADHPEPGARG